jgi:hypothetical protein
MSHIVPGIGNISTPFPTLSQTNGEPPTSKKHKSFLTSASPPVANTAKASKAEDSTIVKTSTIELVAWSGADNALDKRSKRAVKNPNRFWKRFIVAAHLQEQIPVVVDGEGGGGNELEEDGCVTCDKGRDVVCIGDTHFGYCDEGCAEPRKLKDGVKCVDGRINGI